MAILDNNVQTFLALCPLRNYLRVLFYEKIDFNWKLVRHNLKWFLQDRPLKFGFGPDYENREGNGILFEFIRDLDPERDYKFWAVVKFLGERGFTYWEWLEHVGKDYGWGPAWQRKMTIDGVKPPHGFHLKRGDQFLSKFQFDFDQLVRERLEDDRNEHFFMAFNLFEPVFRE